MYLLAYYDSWHWEHEFTPLDRKEDAVKLFEEKLAELTKRKGINKEKVMSALTSLKLDTYDYDHLEPHEFLQIIELKNGQTFELYVE